MIWDNPLFPILIFSYYLLLFLRELGSLKYISGVLFILKHNVELSLLLLIVYAVKHYFPVEFIITEPLNKEILLFKLL